MTPDEFHQALRANIRAYRLAKGMTQYQLSEAIGHAPKYIVKIEIGHRKATLNTLAKIAEALGVSLEELMP